jgi:hypothetical protein
MWTNEWKGDNLINGSKITKHFLSTKPTCMYSPTINSTQQQKENLN